MESGPDDIDYSIIIPCYCSGKWLEELVEEVQNEMGTLEINWDMWLIDDASPDNGATKEAIKQLSKKYANTSGISLQFNAGQTAAQICGYAHSEGKVVINMADDFQNPPSEIRKLIQAYQENPEYDCIFGKEKRRGNSFFRRFGSKMIDLIYRRSRYSSGNVAITSFSILSRTLADSILRHESRVLTLGPMILQNSSQIMNIEVRHDSRKYGKSGYRVGKLVDGAFDVLVNSGRSPLRALSIVGLLASIISFLVGGFFVYQYLIGNVGVSGFTTIVTIQSLFFGLTVLMLGILFEYIIRIVTEVSRGPRYHVKEIFHD